MRRSGASRRILILRPGAIGDALLTFPILRALRNQHANTHPHITFVSNPAVLPLALACNVADDVADFGDMRWAELFSSRGISTPNLQQLFQQTDLAIGWLHDRDGRIEQNIRKAGAKQVIIAPGRPSPEQHIHIVKYLAQTIGLAFPENINEITPFTLNESLPEQVDIHTDASQRLHVAENKPIVIHPGSGGSSKCWPPSSFAQLIEQLWQHQFRVLLLSSPADTERVQDILHSLSAPQLALLTHLENAPLLEVAHALLQCRYYLGNDSGITHLAALLGIPITVLFGPSDPLIWRPAGASVQVMYAPHLENLAVDEVVKHILNHITEF